MKVSAVILAAGKGTRMKSDIPKTFMELSGKPLFLYALETFLKTADEVLLVISEEMETETRKILTEFQLNEKVKVVYGGAERYDSSYNGIKEATGEIVLIHDAARPFVSEEIIRNVIKGAEEKSAAIPVVPVKDTIKIILDNEVLETPNRSSLFAVQTPQGFRRDRILAGYEKMRKSGNENITDDSMVFELYCDGKVSAVPGDYNNFKVTTPEDLTKAELQLKDYKM